ncbi:MAG: hypothetical protein A4E38_00074 [Methanoregulaceae archaeon PtaB.Bin108]|nr:MAG: hypothetical protein A4E38_00074 [Methanoregulaceae archaeon PtaB.Bin108]
MRFEDAPAPGFPSFQGLGLLFSARLFPDLPIDLVKERGFIATLPEVCRNPVSGCFDRNILTAPTGHKDERDLAVPGADMPEKRYTVFFRQRILGNDRIVYLLSQEVFGFHFCFRRVDGDPRPRRCMREERGEKSAVRIHREDREHGEWFLCWNIKHLKYTGLKILHGKATVCAQYTKGDRSTGTYVGAILSFHAPTVRYGFLHPPDRSAVQV